MRPRLVRTALIMALAATAMLAAGFAWFVSQAWRPMSPPPRADGIVVLTGGADRLALGFRLLDEGLAQRLLITGVGAQASFRDLAHAAGANPALAPKVTLGRQAGSTHGNAVETAEWARAQHLGSLIVVTAGYHMPRALAELRRHLPRTALLAAPVQPPAMRSAREPEAWRLLAEEYVKFLAVEAGVSEWDWR